VFLYDHTVPQISAGVLDHAVVAPVPYGMTNRPAPKSAARLATVRALADATHCLGLVAVIIDRVTASEYALRAALVFASAKVSS
jgi:hypothetical protein